MIGGEEGESLYQLHQLAEALHMSVAAVMELTETEVKGWFAYFAEKEKRWQRQKQGL